MTRGPKRGKKQCSERDREVCKCVYLSTFVCACVCVYLLSTLTLYRIHCELLPPRRPWWLSLSPVGISILHFVLFQLFLTHTHICMLACVCIYFMLFSALLSSSLLFFAASACFVVLLSTATVAQVCIVSRLFIYLPTWLPHTCFFLFFTLLSHPSPPSPSPFLLPPLHQFQFQFKFCFQFFSPQLQFHFDFVFFRITWIESYIRYIYIYIISVYVYVYNDI